MAPKNHSREHPRPSKTELRGVFNGSGKISKKPDNKYGESNGFFHFYTPTSNLKNNVNYSQNTENVYIDENAIENTWENTWTMQGTYREHTGNRSGTRREQIGKKHGKYMNNSGGSPPVAKFLKHYTFGVF